MKEISEMSIGDLYILRSEINKRIYKLNGLSPDRKFNAPVNMLTAILDELGIGIGHFRNVHRMGDIKIVWKVTAVLIAEYFPEVPNENLQCLYNRSRTNINNRIDAGNSLLAVKEVLFMDYYNKALKAIDYDG